MWFHRFANLLFRILFRLLLELDVRGVENTPTEGALIVVINHTSFLDPLIASTYLPRTVIPLAKIELSETPWVGWVFPAYGCIPIKRNQIDHRAIRESLLLLRTGGTLLVAPEGTRSSDGRLQPGRSGVALLAARTKAKILPVAIWGVMPFEENVRRLRRTEAHMVVGRSFEIAVEEQNLSREQFDEITDEIMYRLAELLPAEHRGAYEDLRRAPHPHLRPANPS